MVMSSYDLNNILSGTTDALSYRLLATMNVDDLNNGPYGSYVNAAWADPLACPRGIHFDVTETRQVTKVTENPISAGHSWRVLLCAADSIHQFIFLFILKSIHSDPASYNDPINTAVMSLSFKPAPSVEQDFAAFCNAVNARFVVCHSHTDFAHLNFSQKAVPHNTPLVSFRGSLFRALRTVFSLNPRARDVSVSRLSLAQLVLVVRKAHTSHTAGTTFGILQYHRPCRGIETSPRHRRGT